MTDQQPPRVKEETVSLVEMDARALNAFRGCVDNLERVPFSTAMTIMGNILVQACRSQGVPRDIVLSLVASIYDGAVAMEANPKGRV